MRNFDEIYYESIECLRCNLCIDKCPVVRSLGIDKAPMYLSVYSAMGSRFDIDITAKEAFLCIDCHECETSCPINVPIADTMAYIRKMAVDKEKVPLKAKEVMDIALAGKNILGDSIEIQQGECEIALYLGHAGQIDNKIIDSFDKICKAFDIEYTVLSKTLDSGYFIELSGLSEHTPRFVEENVLEFKKAKAKTIVTPCSYSYEAFKKYYPKDFEYLHISQFLSNLLKVTPIEINVTDEAVGYHDSSFLTRINGILKEPRFIIEKFSGKKPLEPQNTKYHTHCAGIGGGLGLFNEEVMKEITEKRAKELEALECDTIVCGCVFEKYDIEKVLSGKKVVDITEYVGDLV